MAVSKRLRYEILRRDNHACRYCGAAVPDAKLTVDHVIPTALGGSDGAENLVTACVDCNGGKSASSPDAAVVADVKADAFRWARALTQAANEAATERATVEAAVLEMCKLWNAWTGPNYFVPDDHYNTLSTWVRLGVTQDDWADALRTAVDKPGVSRQNTWRYACGVIWRMLDKRTERAREILEGEAR